MDQGYKIIQIPRISDNRGDLSFVELNQLLDFSVQRVYWLYGIKTPRGGHAHKKLKQLIFSAHGSVHFLLDNGKNRKTIQLNSPQTGLVIYSPTWREITHFTSDATVIILASEVYDEEDYIRSHDEFIQWKSHFSI